jgi:hypothetical protein
MKSQSKKIQPKPNLLGTSPTLERLENQINRYFYSTNYKINPETLKLENPKVETKRLEEINEIHQIFPFKDRFQFRKD